MYVHYVYYKITRVCQYSAKYTKYRVTQKITEYMQCLRVCTRLSEQSRIRYRTVRIYESKYIKYEAVMREIDWKNLMIPDVPVIYDVALKWVAA